MVKNITNDIRKTFINYFQKQDHVIVPASSLVPKNDPTLMFTNSGMVQFKNYFTGAEKPPFPRAATVQKSVRAGGKHNDLDNVGYTRRHHTFFEMLGNFSFGDYFKEKAIYYAWELLTKEIGLDKSKLCVTVYHTDEEARNLWKKIAGLKDEDIIPIATKDNFWQMGDTGPCGPCSEIFYDHGEQYWGGRPGTPEEDGDRFIEIWNLVFDQYEDLPDGSRIETPKKSIDTGSGLERVSAILHGTNDNYGIEIFTQLIEGAASIAGVEPYGDHKTSLRVIADHLRSTSFLLADGVLPSNEGRGYVLRRIMRRAMRHAHLIGCQDPLMHKLVPSLVETMGEAYPELIANQKMIEESLRLEETRFKQTLDAGLKLLDAETASMNSGDTLAGEVAFRLYDTYGFPLDLTQDALRGKGMHVDTAGFETAMEKQRAEARKSWAGSGDGADEKVWFQVAEKTGATEFLGYHDTEVESVIYAVVKDGALVEQAGAGDAVSIVANQTPFYGEMGGQVGDTGTIKTNNADITITNSVKKAGGALTVHIGTVDNGTIKIGDTGVFSIDNDRRFNIRAHHSATHLLQSALRQVLGDSVHQKGSMVSPDLFRFDFTYNKAMTTEEIRQVEALVNDMILKNVPVITDIMTPDEAVKMGAMALFDEKYGDTVRVVSMCDGDTVLSRELCGGTHARATGDIGLFHIISESAVAAGVRRIEAVVGRPMLAKLNEMSQMLGEMLNLTRSTSVADLRAKVENAIESKKKMEREIADLRRQVALGGCSASAEQDYKVVNGVKVMGKILHDVPAKELKPMVDEFKKKIGSGIVGA
ncbi:MAG: alanine--tRNA ligase, partial [Alphaproteobacteria bacterium]|nr:alanine--tRNA ligase [Alphaproteobacteria bacterium]